MELLLSRPRLGTVLLVLLCAGCAAQDGQGPPSDARTVSAVHRDIIDRTLAGSPSDLEREALADDWVSDEEYRQAQDAFVACLQGSGYPFEVQWGDDGGYDIAHPDAFTADYPDPKDSTPALDELVLGCENGTLGVLSMLYHGMRDNPEGVHPVQALRTCFEQAGAPEADVVSDDELWQQVRGTPESLSAAAARCVADADARR